MERGMHAKKNCALRRLGGIKNSDAAVFKKERLRLEPREKEFSLDRLISGCHHVRKSEKSFASGQSNH